MSKQLPFEPSNLRKQGMLSIPQIPLNQYVPDFKQELKRYGKERLLRVYYDMLVIREFETMLMQSRRRVLQGIQYNPQGSGPLECRSESAAVGQG